MERRLEDGGELHIADPGINRWPREQLRVDVCGQENDIVVVSVVDNPFSDSIAIGGCGNDVLESGCGRQTLTDRNWPLPPWSRILKDPSE